MSITYLIKVLTNFIEVIISQINGVHEALMLICTTPVTWYITITLEKCLYFSQN